MLLFSLVIRLVSVGLMVLGAGVVAGQDYPNKPIRMLTAAAGSGSDFTARLVGQGISGPLGQPVIVDNRGNGFIAAEVVARTPADGYTLTLQGGAFHIAPLLQSLPYSVADLAPVSLLERTVLILAVHPSVPVKSVKDLIALAKSKPGELNYATAITGGAGHLAGELLKSEAGVKITRIPYKSTTLGVASVMSGEAQLVFADVGLVMPHVKSGKLRAVAVTSPQRSTLVPDLPTVAASGLPGFEMQTVSGILAPVKTPAAIINRLSQEIARLLSRAEVKEKFANAGLEPVGSTPEQYAATIKSDMVKIGKLIKDAGIKAD